LLEGLAEATSGFSKAYFGKLSDHWESRMRFVRIGYAMSAVGKSMMAVFSYPIWVFSSRTLDKLGKGVRTGARDAFLADESLQINRGKVFGFNKMMDTFGASLGVFIAAVYLYYYPGQYSHLFLIAFVPAFVAVFLTFLVKEKKIAKSIDASQSKIPSIVASFAYWKQASSNYRFLVIGFLLFAFFNSSDAFIFLLGKHVGLKDSYILGTYLLFNLLFALLAFPLGYLADKIGMKKTYLIGVVFFAIAYLLFGFSSNLTAFIAAFIVYSIYAAATDGISKAWISKHCLADEKASALGFFAGTQSIVMLIANIVAGIIWTRISPAMLFYISSLGAILVILYFSIGSWWLTKTKRLIRK
jgi:MFS family permease